MGTSARNVPARNDMDIIWFWWKWHEKGLSYAHSHFEEERRRKREECQWRRRCRRRRRTMTVIQSFHKCLWDLNLFFGDKFNMHIYDLFITSIPKCGMFISSYAALRGQHQQYKWSALGMRTEIRIHFLSDCLRHIHSQLFAIRIIVSGIIRCEWERIYLVLRWNLSQCTNLQNAIVEDCRTNSGREFSDSPRISIRFVSFLSYLLVEQFGPIGRLRACHE